MTDRRFRRRHGDAAGGITDHALDRLHLDLVAQRRGGAVGIDVVDGGGRNAGATDRRRHAAISAVRSEEHTSELQSLRHLVCRLLLEKKKKNTRTLLVNTKKHTTHA